jgi:hypothetical protein
MAQESTDNKTTFGTELIEDMKLVLAYHRGEIDLEQVCPKPEPSNHRPR